MDRYIFILLCFFLSESIYSQYSITFNDTVRAYGSGGDGFENIVNDSNTYYILGYTYDGTYSSPHITKVNSYGNITDKRKYIDTNHNYAIYPYNSMVVRDSTLLFCGQIWNNTIGTLGFVRAVNKNTLDTLWTKTYLHPDTILAQTAQDVFSVLTAIKPTPDGGYILTGNYNKNCITGNLRSFLMKIDSVGNVQWRRTYDDVYDLSDVEISSNLGYVLINKYFGPWFIEMDSLGNIVWQKKINNNTLNANVSDVAFVGNNSFVGIVKYLSGGTVSNPIYGLNIFKINTLTQQILWDKTFQIYSTLQCVSMHQAMGVETMPNGDIIVSGTAVNFGNDAVILKLNSNGDSLWCKSYDFVPDPYDCQLNDLIITDDGGFMGVGFWSDQSGPGWTAWMFKTDSNGVVSIENSELGIENNKLTVYPNPATTHITFEWESELPQSGILEIYNALGGFVRQEEIVSGVNTISTENLTSGVYFYRLKQAKKKVASGKIVVE